MTKITVHFERKVGLANYSNVAASAYLEVDVPENGDIADATGKAFDSVKAAVLDQLGIEAELNEQGILVEKDQPVTATGGGNSTGNAAAFADAFGATPATPAQGAFDTRGVDIVNERDMTENVPSWLPDELARLGIESVWANQGKYGQFYKEKVVAGDEPKHFKFVEDSDGNPVKKAQIISKPKHD